jgi:ParB family chromosome partitioning protein
MEANEMQVKSEGMPTQRKALGRGLSALLPDRPTPFAVPEGEPGVESVQRLPIDGIDPNPYQPRRIFNQDAIEELAQSIRTDGLIQPIVVRRNGPRYSLVVGERRWRAARLAGLLQIPAIIQDIPQDRVLEVTLVENIQREDLNPIEVALALNRMIQELGLSHETLASRTGKNRTTITNLLRLLRLPKDIQELVAEKRISMGHARAILALENEEQQRALAEKTAAQGLSVRQVERLARKIAQPPEVEPEKPVDPNVAAAVEELERALGTKVRLLQQGENKGRLEIEYYSAEDLDRIYEVIVGTPA